uniref:Uncharacterized protein n=2 Tax=Cyprinus carpio TaxID=7962 RepID=A0A9J8CM38_CYPCA
FYTKYKSFFLSLFCSDSKQYDGRLYQSHIPTSSNPYRHDMVAVLGATTGQQALIKLRDRMRNDHEGYTILRLHYFTFYKRLVTRTTLELMKKNKSVYFLNIHLISHILQTFSLKLSFTVMHKSSNCDSIWYITFNLFSRLQLLVQSPGPWALRNGSRARCVVSIFYERRWEQDLDELRHELNIEPPPVLLIPSSKNTFSNS